MKMMTLCVAKDTPEWEDTRHRPTNGPTMSVPQSPLIQNRYFLVTNQ